MRERFVIGMGRARVRPGSLRRTPNRLIIRRAGFDEATLSPGSSRDLIRHCRRPHVDVGFMSALPEQHFAIEHSPESSDDATDITELLADLRAGRREAFDRIVPLVYHELRRTASRELAVRPSDTLSTTALVHELYLKFSRSQSADWRNRAHFLGVAAVAMRHILVDRARRRTAEKRGGLYRNVSLDEQLTATDDSAESLLELHEALDQLALLDARLARVVECRFFGGMTEEETAEALGITARTVRRDWVKARGLLYQALGAGVSRDMVHASPPSGPR
jgi:RNA polymerase sigma factor (TIGR02999 family)